VFARQIELLCNKNDIVLAISASGNSENLILGAKAARKRGCTTIGMTAFDGGLLRNLVDISIHVETEVGEYGPAEDVHSMIGHCVTELVRKKSAAL
jgi:D-sedoheptulose 7-phosphate isomerase